MKVEGAAQALSLRVCVSPQDRGNRGDDGVSWEGFSRFSCVGVRNGAKIVIITVVVIFMVVQESVVRA